jgi:hypothetical protein
LTGDYEHVKKVQQNHYLSLKVEKKYLIDYTKTCSQCRYKLVKNTKIIRKIVTDIVLGKELSIFQLFFIYFKLTEALTPLIYTLEGTTSNRGQDIGYTDRHVHRIPQFSGQMPEQCLLESGESFLGVI